MFFLNSLKIPRYQLWNKLTHMTLKNPLETNNLLWNSYVWRTFILYFLFLPLFSAYSLWHTFRHTHTWHYCFYNIGYKTEAIKKSYIWEIGLIGVISIVILLAFLACQWCVILHPSVRFEKVTINLVTAVASLPSQLKKSFYTAASL